MNMNEMDYGLHTKLTKGCESFHVVTWSQGIFWSALKQN